MKEWSTESTKIQLETNENYPLIMDLIEKFLVWNGSALHKCSWLMLMSVLSLSLW